MKKKTLGILITLGLITGIVSPAASVLADTVAVPASTYGITYEAHVQHDGWQSPVTVIGNQDINGVPVAGTTGKARRLEAVKITLSGLPGYAVTYQAHVQDAVLNASLSGRLQAISGQ